MNNEVVILIPKKDLGINMMKGLAAAGLAISKPSDRSLTWDLVDRKLPIVFKEVRATDIPGTIQDVTIPVNVGFTGEDIGVESGLLPMPFPASNLERCGEKNAVVKKTWRFPVDDLVCDPIQSSLTLAVDTRKYTKDPSKLTLSELRGTRIYTSYPQISRAFFDRDGINAVSVDIVQKAGSIEVFPSIDPNCIAVVDVISTGTTQQENYLAPSLTLMRSTLMLFISTFIKPNEEQILEDFMGAIDIAAAKQRRGI